MLSEFWKLKGWIALIPLTLGAVAFYAWIGIGVHARAMERHGVEGEATIVDTSVFVAPVANGGGSTVRSNETHSVTVMFTSGSAMDNTVQVNQVVHLVDKSYYESVSRGDRVWVRYLPDDPQRLELVRGRTQINSTAAGYVALGMLTFGALIVWLIFVYARKINRFKTIGTEVQGVITEIVDQTGVTLLSLTLPDGRAVKSLPIKGKGLPYTVGQTLTVLSVPAIAGQVMVPPAR
jgi:hypothetical protein